MHLVALGRVGCWILCLLALPLPTAAAGDLRLVEAAKQRNMSEVHSLLEQQVDVNGPSPDGATALHWAAHWNEVDTANLLIHAGADVDAANDYGVTPLSLACTNGSAAMVERLLAAGADPHSPLPNGETPLMTAARTGRVDAVHALLRRGVDVGAREASKGQTALMWAASEGYSDVVQLLLRYGADSRARSTAGFTPLLFAAREGDVQTTRILMTAGAHANETASNGASALMIAIMRGHTTYAAFLLDQGADPNAGALTPLHRAVGSWETDVTRHASAESEWSPLGGLRGQAKVDFVKLLLTHGADPNARSSRRGGDNGATPFYLAAKSVDVDVMRVLVAAGADPLVTTSQETTPLMVAAGLGNKVVPERRALAAVRECVALGLDVNAVNAAGETALHGAAYRGATTIVQALVDEGANLNAKNERDWTPLTIAEGVFTAAAFEQFPSTEELLRQLGAEPTPPGVKRNVLAER